MVLLGRSGCCSVLEPDVWEVVEVCPGSGLDLVCLVLCLGVVVVCSLMGVVCPEEVVVVGGWQW